MHLSDCSIGSLNFRTCASYSRVDTDCGICVSVCVCICFVHFIRNNLSVSFGVNLFLSDQISKNTSLYELVVMLSSMPRNLPTCTYLHFLLPLHFPLQHSALVVQVALRPRRSPLELTGVVAQQDVIVQEWDMRHWTVATNCNNTPAIAWTLKGSVSCNDCTAYCCGCWRCASAAFSVLINDQASRQRLELYG